MRYSYQLALLSLVSTLGLQVKADVDSLIIKGSKFFYSNNGTQFYVRGIQYSRKHLNLLPTIPEDSLADGLICSRDVPLLLELGINTVVTTDFNTLADHSACMRAFERAGIRVIAILGTFIDGGSRVNQTLVVASGYTLYDRFVKVIDELVVYSNLMGFMMNLYDYRTDFRQRLPITKAFIRDVKQHLVQSGHENIPVGAYGSNPGKSSLIPEYTRCGEPEMAADFFAFEFRGDPSLDGVLWCANSSVGYDKFAEEYRKYPLPVLPTYGCAANRSHTFQDAQYIYSGVGAEVFSGGIVDDWFQSPDNSNLDTGLVEEIGQNVTLRKGYTALSSQLAMLQPTPTQMNDYSPSVTPTPCKNFTFRDDVDMYPDRDTPLAEINIANTLPTKSNPRLCSCMMQTMNCITDPKSTTEEKMVTHRKLCNKNKSLCGGVSFNSTEGWYSSYLHCNITEKASWVYQQNYLANGNDSAACSAVGGIIQQATPSASLQNDCQVLLRQAGRDGRGTVTFDPATGATEARSLVSPDRAVLSSGAQAGIGVGIGCFTILCIVLGVYFWVRRRRLKRLSESPVEEYHKAELPDTCKPSALKIDMMLDGDEVFELKGDDMPTEVSGKDRCVEADGGLGIIELATDDNKPAELEAPQLKEKGEK